MINRNLRFQQPFKESNFISILKAIWLLISTNHKKHLLITDDTQFGYKVYLEIKTDDIKPCGYLEHLIVTDDFIKKYDCQLQPKAKIKCNK